MLVLMIDVLILLRSVLASLFKSRARLETEILVLRQQINVLRRKAPKRPCLTNLDRLAFVWLYRLCPAAIDALTIIRPETVCDGIGAAFGPIGVGSLGLVAAGLGSRRTFEI
jgi:hypothetical protein